MPDVPKPPAPCCRLCRQFGARLLINDDLALALAVDADGLHLGRPTATCVAARQALRPGACSALRVMPISNARVRRSRRGPIMSPSGPSIGRDQAAGRVSAPLSLFTRCRAELRRAGLCHRRHHRRANAAPLLAAGADLLAVISDLFEAPDVAARALRPINHLFEEEPRESRNQQLFERAQQHIPGGVNSPVRAFRSVGGTPRFFAAGSGSARHRCRWQSLSRLCRLLGAADSWPRASRGGRCRTANGRQGTILRRTDRKRGRDGRTALRLCCRRSKWFAWSVPGTEATMSAIRLARGHTGRDLLIKFEGCYHGHSDSLLVKAGSGC
jgi:hypothetical protein